MTNEEQNQLIQKESKRLWRFRFIKIGLLTIAILLLLKVFFVIRFEYFNFRCQMNVYGISNAMWAYMIDHEERIPPLDAWNDTIMEYTEMGYDLPKSLFICPSSKSTGKMSDYSLNENLIEHAGKMPSETVFIFESIPGWNQSGGSETFSFSNHDNGGWFTTLSRPEGYLITPKEVDRLEWKPEGPKAQK